MEREQTTILPEQTDGGYSPVNINRHTVPLIDGQAIQKHDTKKREEGANGTGADNNPLDRWA